MRKYWYFFIVASFVILLISSCTTTSFTPTVEKVGIADGQYIDPREDLTISWNGEMPLSSCRYEVYVNGEKVGDTSATSLTIPSSYFDWRNTYNIEIRMVDYEGNPIVSDTVTVYTYALLQLYVVEYTSGAAVENAEVFKDDESLGFTDEKGFKEFLVKWTEQKSILIKKDGYALSGVTLNGVPKPVYVLKVLLRKAQINPNPDEEELPSVDVAFYTSSDKSEEADLENLTNSPYVVVNATGTHLITIIYAAAGKVPGAGFFGSRLYQPASNTAEGYVDISGLEGETEIHVVVYDANDNRMDVVYRANIIKNGETELNKYEVLKWSSFGYTNIDAYTRRQGIEFYSLPGDIVKGGKAGKAKLMKDFGMKPLAAPKDTNLWVDVWFIDYDTAEANGLIATDTTAKPEGYIIYRSFDGENWEKAGVVTSGIFRDSDPRIEPGKKVYYKVSAYYPDGESTPVFLGYTIPLDTFNVQLEEPTDGATNVSRDPTFKWKPTNDAFAVIPEGEAFTGNYMYTLWIYDLTQSENHLVPLKSDLSGQLYIGTHTATEVSLKFSDYPWGIIILDISGDTVYLYPYNQLEPNKTYEWAVDLAYAYAQFSDEDGNINSAYSIAIDEGYHVDYFGVDADIFNTFTTGLE